MKKFRVFYDVSDTSQVLQGTVELRLDDEDKTIFRKLKELGLKYNRRLNKVIWWDDDYAEIINKKTERTLGILEVCYR